MYKRQVINSVWLTGHSRNIVSMVRIYLLAKQHLVLGMIPVEGNQAGFLNAKDGKQIPMLMFTLLPRQRFGQIFAI